MSQIIQLWSSKTESLHSQLRLSRHRAGVHRHGPSSNLGRDDGRTNYESVSKASERF